VRLLHFLLRLPDASSTFALKVDALHYFIITVTCCVALCIGLVGGYFLVRYRARSEGELTARRVASHWHEIFFVSLPLTFFLLWFGIGFHDYVWTKTPPKDALDVYVTAKQWMWKFTYPGAPSAINVLHVPVGRPVRLLLTSRDVIHSFYVPDFRMKQDAIPGRYTDIWFQARTLGDHQVLCAEYCGLNHSLMRGNVKVMREEDFDRWLEAQRRSVTQGREQDALAEGVDPLAPRDTLVDQGKDVAAQQGCLKCHTVDGAPHIGPTWLDLYGKTETLSTGERVVVNEGYITQSMMDPGSQIVAGYSPLMPTFQGRVSPLETAALIEYMKTLRSARLSPTPSEEPSYGPIR
jgi:cytochrome c oxidase subunit 2